MKRKKELFYSKACDSGSGRCPDTRNGVKIDSVELVEEVRFSTA